MASTAVAMVPSPVMMMATRSGSISCAARQQLDAVHARHRQIGEQEVAFRASQLGQRDCASVSRPARNPPRQRLAQRLHLRRLIVNHQDAGL